VGTRPCLRLTGGAAKRQVRNGKFYWYVSVGYGRIPERAIGVAVADRPTGPFTDARGSALITGDMRTAEGNVMDIIDPAVIIDDDGQAYLFWGKEHCYYASLAACRTELVGWKAESRATS
jgi:beta-xylosidase